ncbi:MAG: gliding motility-associated C-terminal domain-containing protein [Saprospiraceae bacterium]|uniref:Gliding motility-associated C-terminal domain-containing protein n=1 Tax=Candidatus Opimibacter skivensis TaxID=2982028 RepID=A0A9D7SWF0_9BACT|nr:gliding motility-associated C-terminal domain-containing protein [Candidatus Opimibacter skivensis]
MSIFLHHIIFSNTLLSMLALGFLDNAPHHLQNTNNIGVEICNNALDDDGDGLIDLNDPDCTCAIVAPVSLIPNPSFEDMNCCPDMQSQLACAGTWIQASEPTTDYINMCGYMGWPEFPPPVPFPDGEGIVGFRDGRVRQNLGEPEVNWKEYAGACLLSPLIADTPYVFEFYVGFVNRFKSPDINITFFGTSDCANLPFGVGDEAFGCPTNGPGWVRLGSSFVSGGAGNKWVKTKIEVTPRENITAIAIGPDCPPVQSPISIYYFFDNLTLVDLRSFQFKITEKSQPCADDFLLQVPLQAGFTYQWYKDKIALIGETAAHMMHMYGEGEYQVMIQKGGSCSLSGIYTYSIPVYNEQVDITICEEDVYPFGDRLLSEPGQYIDTFKTKYNCDSVVFLDLHVLGIVADTIQAKMFEGEIYKIETYHFNTSGEYLVSLVSSQGCDSLVFLQLDYYHVYIPNIFSPNGDGINDLFSVYGVGEEINEINLTIYDRWGNQIYAGPEWDGKHYETAVNPGVYTYMVKLKMDDEQERQFAGSVNLIR